LVISGISSGLSSACLPSLIFWSIAYSAPTVLRASAAAVALGL
jgi:hypothetical protein